jgi:AraC family transcriptional regulator of arabinose operon
MAMGDHLTAGKGKAEKVIVGRRISTGLFRMDRAYAHRRVHGGEEWLLFCTLSGAGRITHRLGELRTVPGELALIAPRCPQDYGTHPDPGTWEFVYAHFLPRPTWTGLLSWPLAGPGIGRLVIGDAQDAARIARRLEDMDVVARSHQYHREELALNALEEALLRADAWNQDSRAHQDGRTDPRIRTAIERVCRDLAEPWDVARMANAAGMSGSRFAHLFRHEIGEAPRRFIERQRIERACQLLRTTTLGVAEIALAVGFADPFHFSARFHRATGHAPRAFRSAPAPLLSHSSPPPPLGR